MLISLAVLLALAFVGLVALAPHPGGIVPFLTAMAAQEPPVE